MNYKNHHLTFEKTLTFDGMTDSTISGDKSLIEGLCINYHRSGWHKSWKIKDKEGKEHLIFNTFETLKAIDGKTI